MIPIPFVGNFKENMLFKNGYRITRFHSMLAYKHANLGSMVSYLQTTVPNLLHELINEEKLDRNIKLQLLPTLYPQFSTFHGIIQYKAVMRTTQLIVKKFILNRICHLKIKDLRVIESAGQDFDKVIIKWETEEYNKPQKIVYDLETIENPLSSLRYTNSNHYQWLTDKYGKWSGKNDRVINGIFIFELNETNTNITTHVIDNIEIIDDGEEKKNTNTTPIFC